jgi:hypothetical protein
VDRQSVEQYPWGGSKSPSGGSEGEDGQHNEGGFEFIPEWGRWKDQPIESRDEDSTWGGTTERWERNARARVITKGGSPPPKLQSENLFVDGPRQNVPVHVNSDVLPPPPWTADDVASTLREDEESSNEDDEALFLRKDIPSINDAPEVHERLMQLWQLRQKASKHLVEALDNDDPDLFEKLETTMRRMNHGMHQVMKDYRDAESTGRNRTSYVDVDSLPIPSDGSSSRSPAPDGNDQAIEIILDYENNQVVRRIPTNSSNMNIHLLAVAYLMDVFDVMVTNIEDIIVTCDSQEIPFRGLISEFPILEGDVMEIALRIRTQDSRTPTRVPSKYPGGNSRSHRASSRPGTNEFWEDQEGTRDLRNTSNPRSHPAYRVHPHVPDKTGYRKDTSSTGVRDGAASSYGLHPSLFPTLSVEGYQREERRTSAQEDYEPRGGNSSPMTNRNGGAYDKIKQSFKCPKFSGQQKDWKQWNKGFVRYLSIWDLEHVLDPDFVLDGYPLSSTKQKDNKMVFLILEDAVQSAPMAAAYVRQAPSMNGFEAYYTLHDGFVFAGSTTSTLLLNELSNFRFLPNETPTALVLRLEELFQELELLPKEAAVTFIDTQKIGYLINALRHEEEWSIVSSAITSAQIKGTMTFREACEELKVRCETARAHDLMDRPVKGKKVPTLLATSTDDSSSTADNWTATVKTFISTVSKRLNLNSDPATPNTRKKRGGIQKECLADGCDQKSPFALCGVHYHSLVSAKISSLKLRNGYGDATYNVTTSFIDYPSKVPADRLPTNAPRKVKVGLAEA